MKEERKIFNTITIGTIILDVLLFILGVYLIIKPTTSAAIIGYISGIMLIVYGIYGIIKFILNMSNRGFFMFEMINGILSIILGVFLMTNPFSLANFITLIVGIWMIVSSVFKAALSLQFKKFNEESWLFCLIVAILTLILGILIITNPFSSTIVLATYIGIMLCIYSAMDILEQFMFRKRVKEITKILFK